MSSALSVSQVLECLERLRDAARDCAVRERDLNQKRQSRLNLLAQNRQAATDAQNVQLAEQLDLVRAWFEAAKTTPRNHRERRRIRIHEAWKNSRKQALERIEAQEGRRKYKLQTETMQAARTRKNDLEAAEKARNDFKAELELENQTLAQLENTAREAFQGYAKFSGMLNYTAPDLAPGRDEYQLIVTLRESLDNSRSGIERFQRYFLPRLFRLTPLLVPLALTLGAVPLLRSLQMVVYGWTTAIVLVGSLFAVGFVLHHMGKRQGLRLAGEISRALVRARKLRDGCLAHCDARYTRETERIEAEHRSRNESITQQWGQAVNDSKQMTEPALARMDEKKARATTRMERLFQAAVEALAREQSRRVERIQRDIQDYLDELERTCENRETALRNEMESQWQTLERDWKTAVKPLFATIVSAQSQAAKFPEWNRSTVQSWTPPAVFEHAAKFARVVVDVEKLADALPTDPRLALPGPCHFEAPLLLTFPQQGSVLFETSDASTEGVVACVNNIILRLLSEAPPGRLNFTIFDPVGLGQNFAGVMHLADYEDHLINSRIWTQPAQFEQKLADLNEHMEKVIQMYLRNEYATIAEYNEQAGNIAEKYHFLVVANFPSGFTETAALRLLSIAASGARCGVYTLIHWDHRQPSPSDFVPDELIKGSICLTVKGSRFLLSRGQLPGTSIVPDLAPEPDLAIELIHKIGLSSRDSNRVEVPFSHVAPPDDALWNLETTSELRVAFGRTGATKLQYLAIGKGTRQHALLAGKTGSGKSTLLHVIITNLALWCSPEQVEFYLVDFKKGVEFKCYATKRLPHARVVAIESDREFGLSVLQRVDAELKRRGDLFRNLGVQDLAGYKRAGGVESLPRTLLIIDEFQEFFVEDDKISQSASLLLDRIARQGRAFGVHAILGSQTLGGAYTMARTTLGQMVIRIALQCNEADSYLIMDENNSAPRLLSRPGEGIYNDSAGVMEGNSPFQTVWLSDECRDMWLDKVRYRADQAQPKAYPGPIVFEGDAPADIRENPLLQSLLETPVVRPPAAARAWLGAPNSIKGPTEVTFQRQSGNNLLIIGQRDEAVLAILTTTLVALAAQHPGDTARFIVVDASAPGSPHRDYVERLVQSIPRQVSLARNSNLPEIMSGLASDLKKSAEHDNETTPATYLLIHDLQKFSKLRYEEDFGFSSDPAISANPAVALNTLICEGASHGIHVIASCDTYNNVVRFLSRKALGEFEMRALFQMSANDSASLIDNPRAGNLGLHRAIFSNQHEGYLEVFRPYALPSAQWIEEVTRAMDNRRVILY